MKQTAYHHGALFDACCEKALELIEQNGVETLSLREVARALKVSHAAPYRHFQSKNDLLVAIGIKSFKTFSQALTEGFQARSGHDSWSKRMERMGHAYIQFAEKHPTQYRLMFSHKLLNTTSSPELATVSEGSFRVLEEALREGPLRKASPKALRSAAMETWARIHGLAMLMIDQQMHFLGSAQDQRRFIHQQLAAKALNESSRA